jgi:hypothetical protein
VGKHKFARHIPSSDEEPTNEFQMIVPEAITFSTTSGAYAFTSVSPLIISNDEVVTVNFTSSSPSSKDWIGAYSPINVNITETVPIKYGYCDETSSYLSSGVGYLTFNFTNVRDDIIFYYFTGIFIIYKHICTTLEFNSSELCMYVCV